MTIRPLHLFLFLLIGFFCGYVFSVVSIPSNDVTQAKEISKLKAEIQWKEFKIERIKDTLKLERTEKEIHKQNSIQKEKAVAYYKKKLFEVSQQKPVTLHDTIKYFVDWKVASDSVIFSQDSLVYALKHEIKEDEKYLILLDSAFTTSQQENFLLKQKDSLLTRQILDCNRIKKTDRVIKGFALLGWLIAIIK